MTELSSQHIKISFNDGSVWVVPVKVIVNNRATWYFKNNKFDTFEDAIKESIEYFEDRDDLIDWIYGNMDWKDLSTYAVRYKSPFYNYDTEFGSSEIVVVDTDSLEW